MGVGKGAARILGMWTDEPIDDTCLCGSCEYQRPVIKYGDLSGMFVFCDLLKEEMQIDDGCTSWKRKNDGA